MTAIFFAYQIGSKDVDSSTIDNIEEAETLNQIVETIVDRAGELACPEHGGPPRSICTGPDIDHLALEMRGCCEEMVSTVQQRLNNRSLSRASAALPTPAGVALRPTLQRPAPRSMPYQSSSPERHHNQNSAPARVDFSLHTSRDDIQPQVVADGGKGSR